MTRCTTRPHRPGAKAAGIGPGIAWLIHTYSDKFGWLEAVLKFIF